MNPAKFLAAIYALAEHLIGDSVSDRAKMLMRNYMKNAEEAGLAERALYAVRRYTQKDLPDLDTVLQKARRADLTRLEQLIWRVHAEAHELLSGPR
jgi:hypothetical protein